MIFKMNTELHFSNKYTITPKKHIVINQIFRPNYLKKLIKSFKH